VFPKLLWHCITKAILCLRSIDVNHIREGDFNSFDGYENNYLSVRCSRNTMKNHVDDDQKYCLAKRETVSKFSNRAIYFCAFQRSSALANCAFQVSLVLILYLSLPKAYYVLRGLSARVNTCKRRKFGGSPFFMMRPTYVGAGAILATPKNLLAPNSYVVMQFHVLSVGNICIFM
jgi:hypothetical protein